MNQEKIKLRYSNKAMLVLVGMPIALYIFTAMMTKDFSATINMNELTKVDDLAFALGLFLLRLGSIIMFAIGVFRTFFTIPTDETARWMIKEIDIHNQ